MEGNGTLFNSKINSTKHDNSTFYNIRPYTTATEASETPY